MKNQLVTIVTGGGRGIGRAIATRMARETAVYVVGRKHADIQSACTEIHRAGGIADGYVGDVSDPHTVDGAMEQIRKNGWTVRNLVCNAGIGEGGPSATFDKNTWRRIYDVNVHGSFWFAQACLPSMVQQEAGSICFISSTAGLKGVKYQAAYTSTKHALVGLARSLALEYAKHGIVVVPICPSFVDTDMTRQTIAGLVKHQGLSKAKAREKVANVNPQKRIIPASEVAEMVAFVCSGKVPALNGNPLILSGGD